MPYLRLLLLVVMPLGTAWRAFAASASLAPSTGHPTQGAPLRRCIAGNVNHAKALSFFRQPSRLPQVAPLGTGIGRTGTIDRRRSCAVGEIDDPALEFALDKLAGADLLITEGAAHEANYRFKHALIQDAAYDSLLKSRRQALHRRAAEILAGQPERATAEPEVIAHHFTEAGLDDLAIECWGKAGDQALRRSAFQEAIAHLGKAIAMADKAGTAKAGGASGDRRQLQVSYGMALIAARGHAAAETTEAFARARESAAGDKDTPERLAADYGLWAGGGAA
jgi:hypothetical protein